MNDYRYVIENLSFAMEEIKEQASQDRYSFRGGASSSKISFSSFIILIFKNGIGFDWWVDKI